MCLGDYQRQVPHHMEKLENRADIQRRQVKWKGQDGMESLVRALGVSHPPNHEVIIYDLGSKGTAYLKME